MKLKFVLLLVAILSINCAFSQLLWKISKDGNANVSYLFGTHHLIDTSQLQGFSHVLDLIDTVNLVIGEVDLATPNIQDTILKYALLNGDSIRDYLHTSDYDYLDTNFRRISGMSLTDFDRFKPMFVSSLYMNELYLSNFGNASQGKTIDAIIQSQARKYGKIVVGLETIGEQSYLLFSSIPEKRQAEILINEVKMKNKNILSTQKINKAYVDGDIQKMELLDLEDDFSTPEEKLMMNDYRNERWLSIIDSMINDNSCFIAVGFLHFTGAKGLICSLRKKGYTVTPVNFSL